MPMISYACPECGHASSRLVQPKNIKSLNNVETCPSCGKNSFTRQLGAPASVSKIKIDNGSMQKAVEINPEVIMDNIKRSKGEPDRGF